MFDLQIGVAKIPRHGMTESGDTLEMIERPGGGFSVVLVDAQGSGRGAKSLSNMIVTRAIAQLKDGARDGVVARGVHDYLYTYRMGQVAATLNIITYDQRSGSILVSRNNPAPYYVVTPTGVQTHNEPSQAIGLYSNTKPSIREIALQPYTYLIVFSDGLLKAGARDGQDIALANFLAGWPPHEGVSAATLANSLLARAIELDHGMPSDDMSVVALAVLPQPTNERIRRLHVHFPIDQAALNPQSHHEPLEEE